MRGSDREKISDRGKYEKVAASRTMSASTMPGVECMTLANLPGLLGCDATVRLVNARALS